MYIPGRELDWNKRNADKCKMLCNIISYKAILIRDKGHLLCLAYLVLLISLTKFRSTQSTVAVVLEGLTLFWRISLPVCISMFSPIWFQEKQESSLLWIAPVLSLLFLHFFFCFRMSISWTLFPEILKSDFAHCLLEFVIDPLWYLHRRHRIVGLNSNSFYVFL